MNEIVCLMKCVFIDNTHFPSSVIHYKFSERKKLCSFFSDCNYHNYYPKVLSKHQRQINWTLFKKDWQSFFQVFCDQNIFRKINWISYSKNSCQDFDCLKVSYLESKSSSSSSKEDIFRKKLFHRSSHSVRRCIRVSLSGSYI